MSYTPWDDPKHLRRADEPVEAAPVDADEAAAQADAAAEEQSSQST